MTAGIITNYYSCDAAAELASQAEAAWEAKAKGATSVKEVLAKFTSVTADSETQTDAVA